MTTPSRPRSPLWIVVLALACEEPMHPYRMQALIKQRGKDQVANVAQRNSVYQTIDALLRAGLIEVRETSRDEHRPERTVYAATDEGRAALRSWIRTGITTPAREFPEFSAVLATPYGIDGADDLRALLETRVATMKARLAELEKPIPGLPRIFLLESEHMAAVTRAEIAWMERVVADLKTGRLGFPTLEEVRRIAEELEGPKDEPAQPAKRGAAKARKGAESPEKKRGRSTR